MLPTLGAELSTALVRNRSACCGVTVVLAVLFPRLGSNSSEWVMVAKFVVGLGLTTVARIVRTADEPLATLPTVHVDVAGSYVPWLGVADTKVSPAGRTSWRVTFVALLGPWSVNVMV